MKHSKQLISSYVIILSNKGNEHFNIKLVIYFSTFMVPLILYTYNTYSDTERAISTCYF